MEKENKSIEIRSEKVRNIIGQIPSVLIRNGTFIICVVLVILLIISIFIPYRKTISTLIRIETSPEAYFIHTSESGFFVSDFMSKTTKTESAIGYILGENSVERITSPVKGELLVNIDNEEYLNKGELLGVIIPENHIYYGVAYITVEDYHKVKVGNKVVLTLNEKQIVEGIVEKKYYLSDNQHGYKIKIKFKKHTLHDKWIINTVFNGKIFLYDTTILKKLASSIDLKM